MALNAKYKLFVREYLIDKNASRAARAAGFSAKSAGVTGTRLLKNVNIAEAIVEGLRLHERDLDMRAIEIGITKERWLKEMGRVAFADISDVASVVTKGKGKYQTKNVDVKTSDQWSPSASVAVKKISQGKYGPVVELHSKQAALDSIGRACGWLKDKVEVSGPDGGPQVILTMPSNGREAPSEEPVDDAPAE